MKNSDSWLIENGFKMDGDNEFTSIKEVNVRGCGRARATIAVRRGSRGKQKQTYSCRVEAFGIFALATHADPQKAVNGAFCTMAMRLARFLDEFSKEMVSASI